MDRAESRAVSVEVVLMICILGLVYGKCHGFVCRYR